jgi:hypothetical protein
MRYALMAAVVALLLANAPVGADDATFKPFVLASSSGTDIEETAEIVAGNLEAAGFTIVGQYSPMGGTTVLIVTSDELLQAAAASPKGGYAAGQRVSVTRSDEGVEVAFVNPHYIRYAYRLDSDLDGVYTKLTGALGFDRECGGGDKEMTAKKLGKYNYMMGMPHFDDPYELGSFDSHEEAVAAVEAGLADDSDGLTQVYRIDIPGKQQTVFGVGMQSSDPDVHIDEAAQMQVVDFEGCRKRAYFPYEVLVDGTEVEALHMRFRMAVHYPNLKMMGEHGFTKLMPFPGDIEDALEAMLNEQ